MITRQIACALLLLLCSASAAAQEKFLILPFNDSRVQLQQGPQYQDGTAHFPSVGFPFDYILGTVDDSRSWEEFDVVAAADGWAIQSCEPVGCPPTGYGNYVLIKHDRQNSSGQNYFTLYAHLEPSSIPTSIPSFNHNQARTQLNNCNDRSCAIRVNAGEFIGKTGNTGLGLCREGGTCIHLHFEVFQGGYFTGQIDPYGLSTRTNKLKRDSYWPYSRNGCDLGRSLWLSCPPTMLEPVFSGPNACTNVLDRSSAVPQNYGAPFNFFVTDRELFFEAFCRGGPNVEIVAGHNYPQQITYIDGYHWNGARWVKFQFNGPQRQGDWFAGRVSATIPTSSLASSRGAQRNWFVAYTCWSQNGEWKCGCGTAACLEQLWQVQGFRFR